MVPVELSRIIISETQDTQVIVLKEKEGRRILPIWIGLPEAMAINRRVRGEKSPRPMTHDLAAELIRGLSPGLERVTVDAFTPQGPQGGGGVFHARLHVKGGLVFDCRPSDAVALAVRLEAPIFVAEAVLAQEGQVVEEMTGEDPGPPPELPGEPV